MATLRYPDPRLPIIKQLAGTLFSVMDGLAESPFPELCTANEHPPADGAQAEAEISIFSAPVLGTLIVMGDDPVGGLTKYQDSIVVSEPTCDTAPSPLSVIAWPPAVGLPPVLVICAPIIHTLTTTNFTLESTSSVQVAGLLVPYALWLSLYKLQLILYPRTCPNKAVHTCASSHV